MILKAELGFFQVQNDTWTDEGTIEVVLGYIVLYAWRLVGHPVVSCINSNITSHLTLALIVHI